MTRVKRSRALSWLCTLAAAAALVLVLFPVYAIIVGSFESTNTLFSGTFYWLPHAATLDNYSTVIHAQSANVVTSLVVGLGTALLALVVAVPAAYALSKYRLRVTVILVSSLLIAQIVPSIVLATSLFIVFHRINLVNSYPGLIIADGTYAVPFAILVLRAFLFSLPNELLYAARVDGATEWQTFRIIVIPLARSAVITVAVFAFGRVGRLHLRPDHPERIGHRADHARDLHLPRQLLDRLGRGDGSGRVRDGTGRDLARGGAAVHRERSHGGLGEGVAMRRAARGRW